MYNSIYIKPQHNNGWLNISHINLSSLESTSDVVHVPDGVLVLLEDVVTFQLQSRAKLAAGHAEVGGQDDPLLDPLSVGGGFGVGSVHALLDSAGQSRRIKFYSIKDFFH